MKMDNDDVVNCFSCKYVSKSPVQPPCSECEKYEKWVDWFKDEKED